LNREQAAGAKEKFVTRAISCWQFIG